MVKKDIRWKTGSSITCIKKGTTPTMYTVTGEKVINGQLVEGSFTEMRCMDPTSSLYSEICGYTPCSPADCSFGKGDPSCSFLCEDVSGAPVNKNSCEECISYGYIWTVFCTKTSS